MFTLAETEKILLFVDAAHKILPQKASVYPVKKTQSHPCTFLWGKCSWSFSQIIEKSSIKNFGWTQLKTWKKIHWQATKYFCITLCRHTINLSKFSLFKVKIVKNIELEIVSLMQYSSVIIAVILLIIFGWQNFSQIVLRAFFEEVLEGGGSIKVLHSRCRKLFVRINAFGSRKLHGTHKLQTFKQFVEQPKITHNIQNA